MTDEIMYDYLLRDATGVFEGDTEVTVLLPQREPFSIGFDASDLPEELPGPSGPVGTCSICNYWDENLEDTLYSVTMDKPFLDRLKSSRIRIDHEAWGRVGLQSVRGPFYMVRGKSITHEQVKLCLKSELPMFLDPDFFKGDQKFSSDSERFRSFFLNSRVLGSLLPGNDMGDGTWLWDTGEIGGSRWDLHYPSFAECMPVWLQLALKYPFLDMVVGYTRYTEVPCDSCPLRDYYFYEGFLAKAKNPDYAKSLRDTLQVYEREVNCDYVERFPCRKKRLKECEEIFRSRKRYSSQEKSSLGIDYADIVYVPDLIDDIELTVHIYDGNLELLTGKKAIKLFRDYDQKYGFQDTWRYATHSLPFHHDLLQETMITEETLRECLKEKNMDPDQCIAHLIKVHHLKTDKMKRGIPRIQL